MFMDPIKRYLNIWVTRMIYFECTPGKICETRQNILPNLVTEVHVRCTIGDINNCMIAKRIISIVKVKNPAHILRVVIPQVYRIGRIQIGVAHHTVPTATSSLKKKECLRRIARFHRKIVVRAIRAVGTWSCNIIPAVR